MSRSRRSRAYKQQGQYDSFRGPQRLFQEAIVPGLMISSLIIIYILIRTRLQPHLAPLSDEPPLTLKEKIYSKKVRYKLILFLSFDVIYGGNFSYCALTIVKLYVNRKKSPNYVMYTMIL